MENSRLGKCRMCPKEVVFSYAGKFRAAFCPHCAVTTLDKWNVRTNLWEQQEIVPSNVQIKITAQAA